MAVRTHEVVFVHNELPLQFDDHGSRLSVVIDNDMLSWTVAEVKQHLLSHGSLAHLHQPPEFLDLLVCAGGVGNTQAPTQEILLRDDCILAHYSHLLHAGHSLLLKRRRLAYEDYMTYWTRRLQLMGINADVLLVMFLVVAIIVYGAVCGMHSVEDTIWWQR
ncbi:hypothetical protein BsWGS_16950 [Bradybaena similaris]